MNRELQGRPKPKFGVSDDLEDELLNYQELFRRSNMEPAAKVIREPTVKRQQSNETEENTKRIPPIDLTESSVMRPIVVERDVSSAPIQLPTSVQDAFPKAKHRGEGDLETLTVPNVKKASLFAKQMYREGQLRKCRELEEAKSTTNDGHILRSTLITGQGLGDITGEREIERIHSENLDRIRNMDENELIAEKEKLLNSLDPKLIAFIRQRHKQQTKKTETLPSDANIEKMETELNQKLIKADLPIEVDSRWIHMDRIEHEKLEWMKDLSKTTAQYKSDESNPEAIPARFDFQGNLIPKAADIPVTAALHHHGEDPDAAGYTLDELFHLSRSTVLQQRVIALQTLANIIRKAQTGIYDINLQLPLIPKLIEAGILFIIRWAMDEQIDAMYMVAIDCLSNLIAPKQDEKILSQTAHWPCGYFQPLLTPPELQLGEKKIESDLTDIEISEQDVIKCLFRMNLLKRIVYLLDRMKSLPLSMVENTIKSIFYILIRMARHSMTCANQIFDERQLMDYIVQEFIPEMTLSDEDNPVYGHLLSEALKLCRVLASCGPSLASNLIARYNLQDRLRNHLVTAVGVTTSLQNNKTLSELLALWRVFILQGQMIIDFGSLIPTVILPLCRSCTQQMPDTNISEILVQLVTLIDSLVIYVTKFIHKHRNTPEQFPTNVNWSHIDGLFDIVVTVGKQTLLETTENINIDNLRTASLSCLASFIIGQQFLNINLLDLPSKIEILCTQLFEPILRLKSTKYLINNVKFETATFPTNSSPNLPSLTQAEISPFGFLIALLRLTNIMYRIQKKWPITKRFITELMINKNSEILVYIKKILNKFTSINARRVAWFEHFEHVFIFELIQVINQEKCQSELPSIYFEILLSMIPSLPLGSDYLAQEILRFLFFDQSFWKRSNEVDLTDLSLISNESLCLASNESISISKANRTILYERAIEHLPSLFSYYKNILRLNCSSVDLNHCDIHFGNFFQSEDSLKLIVHYSDPLIDQTWPYGLLSSLYANVLTIENADKKLELILNTLQFVYILETKQCLNLSKQLTKTTRFSMIAGIYLLGSDTFFERNIAAYLLAFLNSFQDQHLLQKIETKTSIQSLMTFFDFYRSLVDQYEACSFGDILFSNYLLVPLQQIYDIQLRKHLWIEHSSLLLYLRLKPDQILFSLENFFLPYENDLEMIEHYAQSILNETIQKSMQPLLYMIALHHLNAFLFDQTLAQHRNLQKSIVKNLKSVLNDKKEFALEIINYKTFSREGPIIFSSLPSIRVNWLEKLSQ